MRSSKGPVGLYLERCEKAILIPDDFQFSCIKKLEGVYNDVVNFYEKSIPMKTAV